MNKRLMLACLMLGSGLLAREYRTPLNVQQGINGHLHAPLELEEEDLGHKFTFDLWGAGYAQSASDAYDNCHHKVNIGKIFFGKESFRGREFFANGTVSDISDSSATALAFALLTPRVEYNENGAVFGGTVMTSYGDRIRIGARVNLPYRVVEMHSDDEDLIFASSGEEILGDVCVRQSDLFVAGTDPRVTLDSVVDNDWACRLDFLSALCSASCTIPLVHYGTGAGDPTRIHGKDVTETGNLAPDPDFSTGNPVHLIQVPIGQFPTGLLGAPWDPTVAAAPFVSGAGVGPGDGNRARFNSATNYTALAGDPDAQSQFWVVPTLVKFGANNELVPTNDANEIRNMIDQLTDQMDFSIIDFFSGHCTFFDTQKTRGLGDLDTELFIGAFFNKKIYGELQLGIVFPTGKKIKRPNHVYKMATGNNGHFELDLGAMGWVRPIDSIIVKADASYHWVLKGSERVAAAFEGSTIKNINPILKADISWHYFIGHVDLTLVHPENPGLGIDVGYEFYWKSKDDISFKCKGSIDCDDDCNDCNDCDCKCECSINPFDCILTSTTNGITATDFFGISQVLNSCVLEKDTNRIANKLRIEFFHHWNFCDLYAGWSQVFYGKNIMRETSYYLGMSIDF